MRDRRLVDAYFSANLVSLTRDDAIYQMTYLTLAKEHLERHASDVFNRVREGQAKHTTGVGKGVAVPFAKSDVLSSVHIGWFRCPHGIGFEALDGKPVDIFACILGPEREPKLRIEAMEAVFRILVRAEARTAIRQAFSARQLKRVIATTLWPDLSASQLLDVLGSEDGPTLMLVLEHGRVVLRQPDPLLDFVQCDDTGLLVPHRVHHVPTRDAGLLPPAIIEELEWLINNNARESALQRFFNSHQELLQNHFGYPEVHPHVVLSRTGEAFIPDYILTDRDLSEAMILELKLSSEKLVTRQKNQERFTASVIDARTQLLRYQALFYDGDYQEHMRQKLGMPIFKPHLAVIIGRSHEFLSPLDRQKIAAQYPDVQVVTYDDVVAKARRILRA